MTKLSPPRPRGVNGARPPRHRRVVAALRDAAPALQVYAAVRLLGLVVVQVAAAVADKDAYHLLCRRWDSVWYTRIATGGYHYELHLPNGEVHSDLAFFPLLPALERAVAEITPLTVPTAGLLISWTASLAAAWAVYVVGARLRDARTGVVLVALWAAYPTAIVQSMAYTEALFTALAGWSVYAVLTRRWVWAGGLAAFAGLCRPSAAALVAAIFLAGLVTVLRDRRGTLPPGTGRVVLGLLLAPLGGLAYAAYAGFRTGHPLGYLQVQHGWRNGFDGGRALLGFVWRTLSTQPLAGLGVCAVLGLVALLVVLLLRQRPPVVVSVYVLGVVAISLISAGYFGSRPRFLMPAFPLLLPAAVGVARLRPVAAWTVLAMAALASAAVGALILLRLGAP